MAACANVSEVYMWQSQWMQNCGCLEMEFDTNKILAAKIGLARCL
jgi:hypothetical protein